MSINIKTRQHQSIGGETQAYSWIQRTSSESFISSNGAIHKSVDNGNSWTKVFTGKSGDLIYLFEVGLELVCIRMDPTATTNNRFEFRKWNGSSFEISQDYDPSLGPVTKLNECRVIDDVLLITAVSSTGQSYLASYDPAGAAYVTIEKQASSGYNIYSIDKLGSDYYLIESDDATSPTLFKSTGDYSSWASVNILPAPYYWETICNYDGTLYISNKSEFGSITTGGAYTKISDLSAARQSNDVMRSVSHNNNLWMVFGDESATETNVHKWNSVDGVSTHNDTDAFLREITVSRDRLYIGVMHLDGIYFEPKFLWDGERLKPYLVAVTNETAEDADDGTVIVAITNTGAVEGTLLYQLRQAGTGALIQTNNSGDSQITFANVDPGSYYITITDDSSDVEFVYGVAVLEWSSDPSEQQPNRSRYEVNSPSSVRFLRIKGTKLSDLPSLINNIPIEDEVVEGGLVSEQLRITVDNDNRTTTESDRRAVEEN